MNNKVDEYGNIYFFITRKEMGENLRASSNTVIKVFKELEEAKLIKQENQGKGKAYKIYVVDIYSKDMEKLHIGNEKSANKVVEFLPSNNKRKLNTKESIENIAQICDLELEEIPHCDTINDVFKKVRVEKIRKYMINKLIRGKIIKRYKIRDRYYHVIVDGTGLEASRKKYNKNCLVKNKKINRKVQNIAKDKLAKVYEAVGFITKN